MTIERLRMRSEGWALKCRCCGRLFSTDGMTSLFETHKDAAEVVEEFEGDDDVEIIPVEFEIKQRVVEVSN